MKENGFQIMINIVNNYDRRGSKIIINLSDGRTIMDQEKYFDVKKAVKYINTLIAEGYKIESKFSQKHYDELIAKM